MKIGIVGCGRFGSAVLDLLADMGHEITAMDTDIDIINEVNDSRDVLAICGNGTDVKTLAEIGAGKMDVFIACTVSDDVNMLSSYLAKKMGAKHTIARMRNQRHDSREALFLKEALGLDFIANPDHQTAKAAFNHLHDAPLGTVMILGATRATFYLANMLISDGHKVKIIDRDLSKCEMLCENLPEEVIIINGNSADHKLLISEGLDECVGLVSLSDIDEENILTSMFANEHNISTIVTRVNKTSYTDIVHNLNLNYVISPITATAEIMVNYIEELDIKNEQKTGILHFR